LAVGVVAALNLLATLSFPDPAKNARLIPPASDNTP